MMRLRQLSAAICLAALLPAAASAETYRPQRQVGNVYTMSNAPAGNAILIYARLADGRLQARDSVPTGGLGTGTGLGNQGAIILSGDQRFLLAVNAGDDSVSVFRIKHDGLLHVGNTPSGGRQPISVTEDRDIVYVLNAGTAAAPGNISGFYLNSRGSLTPIADSTRLLSNPSASTGPAQIQFSRDGRTLIVTEKATNLILIYAVDRDGVAGTAQVNESAGATPFGFAVGKRGQVFVSEAAGGAPDASTLSSYRLRRRERELAVISAAVPTTETAACWVAVTPDGRFAFTTNTGSGTISAFRIRHGGKLVLADADAGNTGAGSGPIDLALSPAGRQMFVLNAGNETIASFRVGPYGQLTPVDAVGNLPDGANGIAVR